MGATKDETDNTNDMTPVCREDTATQTDKRKSGKKKKGNPDSKQDDTTQTEKRASNKKPSKKDKARTGNVTDDVQSDEDAEQTQEDDESPEMELDEELDITIMKQKEYLFEKQFLWNSRVKWDILKSDIFSNTQCDNLQRCNGKKAGYLGLMEALKEAEGAEDLADLAKALQPSNPVLAMELQAELDLALGITPIPQRIFRDAVKCTRTTFGRGGMNRDDENRVIRLLSQRMVYGAQVGQATVALTQQQGQTAKNDAEFSNNRVERLATELERLLQKQGVGVPKQMKKSKSKKDDDVAAFKMLEAVLDPYFTYSEERNKETKKVEEERAKTVRKVLKKDNVDDLCAAIEEALEERQAKLRENQSEEEDKPKQDNQSVSDEDIANLEKEVAEREKEMHRELDAYRADELKELKSRKANFKKDRDEIKAKRNDMKAEVQEQKQQLEFVKAKVERLEKVLGKVLKGAAY